MIYINESLINYVLQEANSANLPLMMNYKI